MGWAAARFGERREGRGKEARVCGLLLVRRRIEDRATEEENKNRAYRAAKWIEWDGVLRRVRESVQIVSSG